MNQSPRPSTVQQQSMRTSFCLTTDTVSDFVTTIVVLVSILGFAMFYALPVSSSKNVPRKMTTELQSTTESAEVAQDNLVPCRGNSINGEPTCRETGGKSYTLR